MESDELGGRIECIRLGGGTSDGDRLLGDRRLKRHGEIAIGIGRDTRVFRYVENRHQDSVL
jgi:hypothetical protein